MLQQHLLSELVIKTRGEGGNEYSLPVGYEVNSASLDVAVPVCPVHDLMPGKRTSQEVHSSWPSSKHV